MAEINPGDKVRVHVVGTMQDGTTFLTSRDAAPVELTVGDGAINPGIDAALMEMSLGETRRITVPSDAAYGARDRDRIKKIPRSELPAELSVTPGMQLELQDPSGRVIETLVVKVTDDEIFCDFNHPLAGEDLTFEIELVGKA
jgi:peptidylprolyl isomerase